jgi:integrative and conjugative element protein (TIGR02256 family)
MTEPSHSSWRSTNGKYAVTIGWDCFEAMLRLARRHHPNEIGTSLVGSYSDDGHGAFVAGLAPVSDDSHGARTTFHRGVAGLRRFFEKLFTASKGRSHYIGEWHSHPGGAPVPSSTDEANTLEIANDPRAQCGECILVIVALQRNKAVLGVYIFSRGRGRTALIRVGE